jgi:hypothetical protein
MKNRSINMLIVATIVLTAMSIMLLFFLNDAHNTFEGDITVNEYGVTETVIPIRDLTLTPGDQKDYDVNVYCKATGSYHVSIDVIEDKDGGMKKFVNVKILSDGAQIYEGALTELIDDDLIIIFDAELDNSRPTVLTFIYEMPLDTGNEAQGTFSDFDIQVNIKKN